MTARQIRSQLSVVATTPIHLSPADLDRLQAAHDGAGEPGRFPYAPDPVTTDLVQAAFRRGVELGRRLQAEDQGIHAQRDSMTSLKMLWGGCEDGPHDPIPGEDKPDRLGTGAMFLIVCALGAGLVGALALIRTVLS